MAQIRPFRAYRPCQGMEKRIAALPYDVYNREEACEVVKKNPDSFLAVDRAETQFGEEVDTMRTVCMRKRISCFGRKFRKENLYRIRRHVSICMN